MKYFLLFCIFLLTPSSGYAGGAQPLLEKGWQALVQDDDVTAFRFFGTAYERAKAESDTEAVATALLFMGICQYSVSYSTGIEYALQAMDEFKKLERNSPAKALKGRSRSLQLISTIYNRQGKYRDAIKLSMEALGGFSSGNDTSGYPGLIYTSLGVAYNNLNIPDSSEYYHRLALTEHLKMCNFVYLPTAYLNVAEIELKKGDQLKSRTLFDRAYTIADSTGNRQAMVSTLLGIGKWNLIYDKTGNESETIFLKAKQTAAGLTDKSFYLQVLENLITLKKQQNDFKQALVYEEEVQLMKDTLYSWDKQKAVKSLEIQFEVSEKDRQLRLIQKENDIATLTNYILWGTIGFIVLIAFGIITFLKRINNRDKSLLQSKEKLVQVIEEQKALKEKQMQNELEFKESQLSAMTFQMLQKNELMQELKEGLEKEVQFTKESSLNKIINKGLNHDKEWSDFNTHFESINKNFYARLKQAYPDISPNDLKICALIKLNLSIKEMAGILNISPDSVKTARYRLRKKLQLNTEDNLTDFILNIE